VIRQINRLSARTAETLSKPGRHADGGGLYLSISDEGRRRWVFMYVRKGKQREAGLGSASKAGVSLKVAREKAAEGRAMLRAGVDPLGAWNKPAAEEVPTFGVMADAFLDTHKSGWRNEKHRQQWTMTLTRYCEPIRATPVDAIDTEAVFSILKPLWARAPETASRLRGRIDRLWTPPRRADTSAATRPIRRVGAAIWISCCQSAPSSRAATTRPCLTPTFPFSWLPYASVLR
jgi:Arm DNA-binding domain